jgi:hypothetical protein
MERPKLIPSRARPGTVRQPAQCRVNRVNRVNLIFEGPWLADRCAVAPRDALAAREDPQPYWLADVSDFPAPCVKVAV